MSIYERLEAVNIVLPEVTPKARMHRLGQVRLAETHQA
jgi:hypothetical protein